MSLFNQAFRALGPIDLRNMMRDSLMKWMVFIPIVYAFMVRFITPPVADWLLRDYNFDLSPYYHLVLAFMIVLANPVVFGFVIGMLLLDERDDDTLTALRVTPLPMLGYAIYKLTWPTILGYVLTLLGLWLAGLTPDPIPWLAWILACFPAALLTPWTALLMAAFAKNKVEGFAMIKSLGGSILLFPIAAWFIPMPWRWLVGILPTFWPAQVYWSLLEYNWAEVAIGAVGTLVVLGGTGVFFWQRFSRNLNR